MAEVMIEIVKLAGVEPAVYGHAEFFDKGAFETVGREAREPRPFINAGIVSQVVDYQLAQRKVVACDGAEQHGLFGRRVVMTEYVKKLMGFEAVDASGAEPVSQIAHERLLQFTQRRPYRQAGGAGIVSGGSGEQRMEGMQVNLLQYGTAQVEVAGQVGGPTGGVQAVGNAGRQEYYLTCFKPDFGLIPDFEY